MPDLESLEKLYKMPAKERYAHTPPAARMANGRPQARRGRVVRNLIIAVVALVVFALYQQMEINGLKTRLGDPTSPEIANLKVNNEKLTEALQQTQAKLAYLESSVAALNSARQAQEQDDKDKESKQSASLPRKKAVVLSKILKALAPVPAVEAPKAAPPEPSQQ